MEVLVKICGLTTHEALDAALAAGTDFLGFVFLPSSPRHLDVASAADLGRRAANRAAKVAVTVDAGEAQLEAIVEALRPDLLQLHGSEPPERVAELKARFGMPVIKALPVATVHDLAAVSDYGAVAEWLLFDARPPPGSRRPGGHGRPFDWGILGNLDHEVRYMLSGGLHAGNVASALQTTRAAAVDVSSGVERDAAIKDADKIRAFIRAARQAGGRR